MGLTGSLGGILSGHNVGLLPYFNDYFKDRKRCMFKVSCYLINIKFLKYNFSLQYRKPYFKFFIRIRLAVMIIKMLVIMLYNGKISLIRKLKMEK